MFLNNVSVSDAVYLYYPLYVPRNTNIVFVFYSLSFIWAEHWSQSKDTLWERESPILYLLLNFELKKLLL